MVGDKIPGMGGGAAEPPADGEAPAEVQNHFYRHLLSCQQSTLHRHNFGKKVEDSSLVKEYFANDHLPENRELKLVLRWEQE